jgi:hypothetical protein
MHVNDLGLAYSFEVKYLQNSHSVPLKPGWHRHRKELKHGTHVAPLRHGLLRHTSEKKDNGCATAVVINFTFTSAGQDTDQC